MKLTCFLVLVPVVSIAGYVAKALPPVAVKIPTRTINYLKEVKPLLDKRCVVSRSCYNSPCQLKLDSFNNGYSSGTVRDVERGIPFAINLMAGFILLIS